MAKKKTKTEHSLRSVIIAAKDVALGDLVCKAKCDPGPKYTRVIRTERKGHLVRIWTAHWNTSPALEEKFSVKRRISEKEKNDLEAIHLSDLEFEAAERKKERAEIMASEISHRLYQFDLTPQQEEEIDSLPVRLWSLNEDGKGLRGRAEWLGVAYMCLGKAQRIDEGAYDINGEADEEDPNWADELRDIANIILAFFQPGDGKL